MSAGRSRNGLEPVVRSFKVKRPKRDSHSHRMHGRPLRAATVAAVAFITFAAFSAQFAVAATATVDLGNATSFAVLAGTSITNSGPTTVTGDIGVYPGTSIGGFPPGVAWARFTGPTSRRRERRRI